MADGIVITREGAKRGLETIAKRMAELKADPRACDEQQFATWFMENYPPGSTINDPAWHAKRIWLYAGRARSEESDG